MGLSDCRGHLRMGLAGWPKARPRRDRAALELNRVCRRVLGIERCPASLGPENNSDGHGLCSMDRHRSRRDVRAGPDAVQRGGDAGAVLLRRADRHRYRRIEVLERLTPVAMRGKVRKKSRKREEKGTGKGDALISPGKGDALISRGKGDALISQPHDVKTSVGAARREISASPFLLRPLFFSSPSSNVSYAPLLNSCGHFVDIGAALSCIVVQTFAMGTRLKY